MTRDMLRIQYMCETSLILESGLLLTQTELSIPRTESFGNTCGSVSGRVASNTRSGRVDKRERRTCFARAARRRNELSTHTLRKTTINAGLFSIWCTYQVSGDKAQQAKSHYQC